MRVRSAFALIFASLVASLTAFITPASAGDYYYGGGGGYYGPRYVGYNGNGYYGNGNGYGDGYYRPRYYNGGYTSSCCYRKISHYQRVGYDGYYGNG